LPITQLEPEQKRKTVRQITNRLNVDAILIVYSDHVAQ